MFDRVLVNIFLFFNLFLNHLLWHYNIRLFYNWQCFFILGGGWNKIIRSLLFTSSLSTSQSFWFLHLYFFFLDLMLLDIKQLSVQPILIQVLILLSRHVLLIIHQPIQNAILHLFLQLIHLIKSQSLF